MEKPKTKLKKKKQKHGYLSETLFWEWLGFGPLPNLTLPYNPEDSEVTTGQWPFLTAETQKCTAFLICGKSLKTPVSYINVQLLSSVPKCIADQALTFFNVLIGTIVDIARVLPIGGKWASSANDSFWIPISTDICKFRQDTWLCPEQQGTLNSLQLGL